MSVTTTTAAEALRAAGEALFGETWIGPTAKILDVDTRRIQRMVTGAASVPAGLLIDLAGILDACITPSREERANALIGAGIALRRAAATLPAPGG